MKIMRINTTYKVIMILILLCVGAAYKYLDYAFHKFYDQHHAQYFLIPPKTSTNRIAEQLCAIQKASSVSIVKAIIVLYGYKGRLKAGEYLIPQQYNLKNILDKIAVGQVVLHNLTVPEGLTSFQVRQIINDNILLSGPPIAHFEEATILPETYKFPRNMERQKLFNQMQRALNIYMNKSMGFNTTQLSRYDILRLASIVEMETAVPQERPLVASVFLNRLKIGMPLQCDATVVYALSEKLGRQFQGTLSRIDLLINHPCNTYINRGLPSTPICHPGQAAIKAVLNPAESPYLYFVADGSGGHIFAANLSDHSRNHQSWRKIKSAKQSKV